MLGAPDLRKANKLGGVISDAQLLSTMLAVESFLLATVSLAVTMATPRAGFRDMPVKPMTLGFIAVGAISAAALGAFLAWLGIYATGEDGSFREWSIGVLLLLIMGVQPVIATLLALGLRIKP